MSEPKKDTDQNVCGEAYQYKFAVAPEYGRRTVRVIVTEGALKGKSALVIKMPDQFSGFFPEMDPNILSGMSNE